MFHEVRRCMLSPASSDLSLTLHCALCSFNTSIYANALDGLTEEFNISEQGLLSLPLSERLKISCYTAHSRPMWPNDLPGPLRCMAIVFVLYSNNNKKLTDLVLSDCMRVMGPLE